MCKEKVQQGGAVNFPYRSNFYTFHDGTVANCGAGSGDNLSVGKMTIPTPAQQHILAQMEQGFELSSYTTIIDGEVTNRTGRLRKDMWDVSGKSVSIKTIDALLGQNLIAERRRYLAEAGTWNGQPCESWHIDYWLAKYAPLVPTQQEVK